eukprot:gene13630-biopygen12111
MGVMERRDGRNGLGMGVMDQGCRLEGRIWTAGGGTLHSPPEAPTEPTEQSRVECTGTFTRPGTAGAPDTDRRTRQTNDTHTRRGSPRRGGPPVPCVRARGPEMGSSRAEASPRRRTPRPADATLYGDATRGGTGAPRPPPPHRSGVGVSRQRGAEHQAAPFLRGGHHVSHVHSNDPARAPGISHSNSGRHPHGLQVIHVHVRGGKPPVFRHAQPLQRSQEHLGIPEYQGTGQLAPPAVQEPL